MSSLDVDALFARTLVGNYEDEEPLSAVSTLRQHGSRQVFDRAAAWCSSPDPLKRARAAAILCQLRCATVTGEPIEEPEWMFREESYLLIAEMSEREEDTMALESEISALGHLRNVEAVPVIIRYQDHPGKDIRFAVSFALGCFPDDARSISTLLQLTSDPDADVRDWAVFGFGVLGSADSSEIREALLRCLGDTSEDVREEAAVALGKRHDERVLPTLFAMLDEPELGVRVVEAVSNFLRMDAPAPDWTARDYKAALNKFMTRSDGTDKE